MTGSGLGAVGGVLGDCTGGSLVGVTPKDSWQVASSFSAFDSEFKSHSLRKQVSLEANRLGCLQIHLRSWQEDCSDTDRSRQMKAHEGR